MLTSPTLPKDLATPEKWALHLQGLKTLISSSDVASGTNR